MSDNYTILGFGKSAQAALDFLLDNGETATIYDSKPRESFDKKILESYENKGVQFLLGDPSGSALRMTANERHSERSFRHSEQSSRHSERSKESHNHIFIVSPGIPPSSELIQDLKKNNARLKTDLDLFTEALTEEEKYIAVTGTNGKTTTTSLIAHIFNTKGLGNIGKPFLEFNELNSPFICEISSFQIFYSELKRLPDIAVHLNLTDDHLDWHSSLEEYKNTKARLFQNSSKETYSILNYDDKTTRELGESLLSSRMDSDKSKVIFFSTKESLKELSFYSPLSAYIKDSKLVIAKYLEPAEDPNPELGGIISSNDKGDYYLEIPILNLEDLKIVGEHNYSNALASILTAFVYGFDIDLIADKLKSFKAVPHRLEYVAELEGHRIFNDSKATNPDSAIRAIDSFETSILIAGGKNKNLDLSEFLNKVIKKCHGVVLIGELKDAMADYLSSQNYSNFKKANDLEQALKLSLELADETKLPIVLSPASSSFDMFKSYEDRGDQFKQVVNRHSERSEESHNHIESNV